MKLASVHIYLIGPDIWPKGSSSFQNLVAQEPSGHPLGRQSIWSPIRSPEHLVVNLVVVDAFSITKLATVNKNWSIIVTNVFLLTYLLMNLTHLVTMPQVTGKK